MTRSTLWHFLHLLIVLTCTCSSYSWAQQPISGQVFETHSKAPLPFAHLIINNGEQHLFTDVDGRFTISDASNINDIIFRSHLHRPYVLDFNKEERTDSLQIHLNYAYLFMGPGRSDERAVEIIDKVKANEWRNDPLKRAPFQYKTYNKLIFGTEQLTEAKASVNDILHLFMVDMPDFGEDHHLMLMESVSERNYRDILNQKEVVGATRISGVNRPNFFTVNSQLQPLSVYSDFLNISGSNYVSPLSQNPHKRYLYQLTDTAVIDGDTVWVLQYGPKERNPYGKLRGLLYISSDGHAVQYFTASPAASRQLKMNYYQEYAQTAQKFWFPKVLRTDLRIFSLTAKNIDLSITNTTYLSEIKSNVALRRADFDEVVLEFDENKLHINNDSLFWDNRRSVVLQDKDRQTYSFYDSIGNLKNVNKLLTLGESIYTGRVPMGKIDFDLHRLFSYNEYEGLRLGAGAHTNSNFSTDYSFGGYVGYGLKDSGLKFGLDGSYRIIRHKELWFNASVRRDVQEAGAIEFPFDRHLFSSEFIRAYRLRIMDKVWEEQLGLSWSAFRYVQMRTDLTFSREVPTYEYQFAGHESNRYDFSEWSTGFRLGYGERFIRVLSDRLSLGSRYPILWFRFGQGVDGLLGSDFSYRRYDVKLEQSLRILGFGLSTVQVTAGTVSGDVPYMKLYNGKGSYRPPSSVIHNSFETMRYNEFLSSRHVSIFYSHSFGRLYFEGTSFSPSLEMMHNIGFGGLEHPERHLLFPFKTMERGYFESGMFLNNLIRLQLSSLKVGIGAGGFVRYGSYANPGGVGENLIFKFSTTFGL